MDCEIGSFVVVMFCMLYSLLEFFRIPVILAKWLVPRVDVCWPSVRSLG